MSNLNRVGRRRAAWSCAAAALVVIALGCDSIADFSAPAVNPPPVAPSPPIPTDVPLVPIQGRIAFDSDRDGTPRIYLADSAGIVPLVAGIQPAWSPDGRAIAFQSSGGISIISVDGSNERLIVSSGQDPSWSPDGKQLVFTDAGVAGGGIRVVNADGTGDRVLVRHNFKEEGAWAARPAWSRDGRSIAFVLYDCCWMWPLEIYMVSLDGTAPKLFSRFINGVLTSQWAPVWSPDGASLAYVRQLPTAIFSADVAIVDTSGSNLRVLGTGAAWEGTLDWSPDGGSLVLSDYNATGINGMPAGHLRIYVLDIATRELRRLIPDVGSVKPDYNDNNATWTRARP